jgi:hypothetical protein
MFGALKRLWALGPGRAGVPFDAIESRADRSKFRFRRAKDGLRFEPRRHPADVVRMEWGPSQRSFIESSELRDRHECPVRCRCSC